MPKMTVEEQKRHDEEIAAWLAKGNKITICEPGERSDTDFSNWGKKKKTAEPKKEKVDKKK